MANRRVGLRTAWWLAAWSIVGGAATAMDAVPTFQSLVERSWQYDLGEDPLFATWVGDHAANDRLPRETVADQQRRLAAKREFLAQWQAIPRQDLPRSEQMNFDIFGLLLQQAIAEAEFATYLIPITNRSGFHVSFPELPNQTPLNTTRDYENYVARLRAFAQYTDDHIELMRAGIAAGMVLPSIVLEGYQDALTAHIVVDPTKSVLYAPFAKFPARVDEADQTRLQAAGAEAIATSVAPAYRRFQEFMEQEYVPHCRGSIAASALPNGREYYRHCVRKFTTLDLSPEQVHATGLTEVRRIRGEMEQIIQRVQFQGDFAAFVAHLRSEPRFYADSPAQLQKEVAWILKRIDGELPKLFKTLPRTPYGLKPIPDYIAPKTTSAYYQQPTGDGSVAGFYFINTFNLKARPLYEMEALSLHEAVPGHHLQLAIQQELGEVPPFRRFAGVTAFIEGWGLYAERLGLEVGFYTDPYNDFGRLTFEMWRACRLVVDTGVHYLGWTREQAIRFMADNTALSLHNIESEVDRYISWPGQALAYKIGELKIRELRAFAEAELGDRFDVREFHDVVLGSGAIPLPVLDENVRLYVAQAKRAAPPASR